MVKFTSINHAILGKASVVFAFSLALSACGESTSSVQGEQFSQGTNLPVVDNGFNQAQLVETLTDNVIAPTYSKFVELAQIQQQSIADYCQGLLTESTDVNTLQSTAQQNWRDTMTVWQMAEVMQIGPLLENNGSLRNKIYSWPNTSSCAVDQDVVLAEQGNYNISSRTASRKGLDALEYLLFNPNLEHSCTVFGTEPAGWNNRSDDARQIARCQFAELVATELVNDGQQVVDAWTGESGYAQLLKNAGEVGSTYQDIHDAVNEISDALFYIDTVTKDAKLATPLGIFANDCGLTPCVQNIESKYANHSLANVISNIQGLNLIFMGGEADNKTGFNDYLIDVGATDTAQKMRNDLAQVIEFTQSLQNSLNELLIQDPAQVQQTHDQLKQVTDSLKSDFIQSLALELPATSAGDND